MPILSAVLVALGTALQATSTHCATSDLVMGGLLKEQVLIGCGQEYSENVLWNLDRADDSVDGVAKRRTTGAGSVVYVVDTGIEASHDEFQRPGGTTNVIGGIDAYGEVTGSTCHGDSPTHPCYSGPDAIAVVVTHGTAVASIVAGKTAGVAPGASIVSVRVFGTSSGSGTPMDFFHRAFDDIVKHAWDPATPPFRTAIVNMSSSPAALTPNDTGYPELEAKMRKMIGGVDRDFNADPNGRKFLFVVAAGNNNIPTSQFPRGECTAANDVATYPALAGPDIDGLITVGGMDRDNHLWFGTCTGLAVEVLAPADHILCASITGHDHYRGGYITNSTTSIDYSSGTSYAVPYVSGIAARMLEANPNLTPVELEAMIKASASFIDPANGIAAGGRVAVLVENPPPPPAKRRAVAH